MTTTQSMCFLLCLWMRFRRRRKWFGRTPGSRRGCWVDPILGYKQRLVCRWLWTGVGICALWSCFLRITSRARTTRWTICNQSVDQLLPHRFRVYCQLSIHHRVSCLYHIIIPPTKFCLSSLPNVYQMASSLDLFPWMMLQSLRLTSKHPKCTATMT